MSTGRPPLPDGFALRLNEARSLDDSSKSILSGNKSVVKEYLPDNVSVEGLSKGFLVFDFSSSSAYCGGVIPSGTKFSDPSYQRASEKRNEIALRRAKFMNAFVATLHAGGQDAGYGFIEQAPVHIGNYIFAEKNGKEWILSGPCQGDGDRRIPAQAITEAAKYMNAIYKAYDAEAIELLSLLQRATFQYSNHDFSSCLITAWSVVEFLQNNLWKEYIYRANLINGGHTSINKDRKKQLEGRDFTASVISQILSLSGIIDDDILNKMNEARKARNNFAHSLSPVGHEMAYTPISLACTLMEKKAGCSFRIGAGFSWRG